MGRTHLIGCQWQTHFFGLCRDADLLSISFNDIPMVHLGSPIAFHPDTKPLSVVSAMNPPSPPKKTAGAFDFNSEIEAEILARISERFEHDCGNLLARILAIGEEFQFHLENGTAFPEGPQLMSRNVFEARELMRRLAELPRKSGPSGCHDLNVLVAEAAGLIRKFLPRGVLLEIRSASESLPVHVDPLAFRWTVLALAWMAAAACSQPGSLNFETSRQAGPAQSGFCLSLAVTNPARPLVHCLGTAPDHINRFVERCGATLFIENGEAIKLWLPEAGVAGSLP